MPGGFSRDDFLIDHDARTATCPAGHTVAISARGWASFGARCAACPLLQRCTASRQGCRLELSEHDRELVEARRAWRDGDFTAEYRRWRPMVERTIAWLVADGHRRVRYRGIRKNQLGLSMRVAAVNLRRLIRLGLERDGAWVLAA